MDIKIQSDPTQFVHSREIDGRIVGYDNPIKLNQPISSHRKPILLISQQTLMTTSQS